MERKVVKAALIERTISLDHELIDVIYSKLLSLGYISSLDEACNITSKDFPSVCNIDILNNQSIDIQTRSLLWLVCYDLGFSIAEIYSLGSHANLRKALYQRNKVNIIRCINGIVTYCYDINSYHIELKAATESETMTSVVWPHMLIVNRDTVTGRNEEDGEEIFLQLPSYLKRCDVDTYQLIECALSDFYHLDHTRERLTSATYVVDDRSGHPDGTSEAIPTMIILALLLDDMDMKIKASSLDLIVLMKVLKLKTLTYKLTECVGYFTITDISIEKVVS